MNKCQILYDIKSLEVLIARLLLCNVDLRFCKNKKFPTPTQMKIIEYILDTKEDVFQKDLEIVLNLRRATVSGVLKTMEKNSLISRISSEKDARVKQIILNPETKELFLKNKNKIEEIEKFVIKDISVSDLEVFSKVVVAMKENINTYLLNKDIKKGDK